MRRLIIMFISVFMLSASSCGSSPISDSGGSDSESSKSGHHHDDNPRPYDPDADAKAELAETLELAQSKGKLALIVMGANWCHDSRGLAAHFEDPEFRSAYIDPYYELLYIDVGEKNRNIDIAQGFGVDDIVGTPTVFIVDETGAVLNLCLLYTSDAADD